MESPDADRQNRIATIAHAVLRLLMRPTGIWLVGIGAFYGWLLWYYRDLSPFYDGGVYYGCVSHFVAEPFAWPNLHCDAHVAPVTTLLYAASQYIDPGNTLLISATNLFIAWACSYAFLRLLEHLFGRERRVEHMLAATIFAVMPVFIVHAFHINLDFLLMAFLVPFLLFLLTKRYLLAGMFALLLMLTKETGVLVVLAVVVSYLPVFFAAYLRLPWREGVRAMRACWPLGASFLLYAVYYMSFRLTQQDVLRHWGEGVIENRLLKIFFTFNPSDPSLVSYLANIFILNFNWLLTGFVVFGLLVFILRRFWGGRQIPRVFSDRASAVFSVVLFIALVYIVTRMRPWNNPRYVLVAYPLLIVLAVAGLRSFVRAAGVRLVLLTVSLALIFASNIRTFDPLSKAVYGVFSFGEHQWLFMNSRMAPMDSVRDQQAYNLEFLELHYALWDALQKMPTSGGTFAVGRDAEFLLPHQARPSDLRPVWEREDTYHLDIVKLDEAAPLHLLPRSFFYVQYPNINDVESLERLKAASVFSTQFQAGRNGYEVTVHQLLMPVIPAPDEASS